LIARTIALPLVLLPQLRLLLAQSPLGLLQQHWWLALLGLVPRRQHWLQVPQP
jgi:hypothetical protein